MAVAGPSSCRGITGNGLGAMGYLSNRIPANSKEPGHTVSTSVNCAQRSRELHCVSPAGTVPRNYYVIKTYLQHHSKQFPSSHDSMPNSDHNTRQQANLSSLSIPIRHQLRFHLNLGSDHIVDPTSLRLSSPTRDDDAISIGCKSNTKRGLVRLSYAHMVLSSWVGILQFEIL